MKLKLVTIVVVLTASTALLAQERVKKAEVEPAPSRTTELITPDGSDPGTTDSTVPELASIVVLCATEPNSKQFKKEWKSWIASNYRPGMDIDAVVADVMSQAKMHRLRRGKKTRSTKSSKKISTAMHDTAMAVIKNIR